MKLHTAAYEGTYHGEKAIWLKAGAYEAAVLPEIGANLIAFRDTEKQYRFLREPEADEMEEFKKRPIIHGIPVLFPPNRYEDGKFPWNGQCYSFPINEPNFNNHLHGFLYDIPWQVKEFTAGEVESRVILAQTVGEGHAVYNYFPHSFTVTLSYTLSDSGLRQHVMVRNDGDAGMPCLLAFHTAINAPFAAGGSAEDCRLQVTIGKRWELNDRMLPTGRFQPLTPEEEQMKREGISPYFEAMDNHYTSEARNGRNRMVLTDARQRVKLIYDAGAAYKQWMIWNNKASRTFFCPEPQINLVNAPNVSLPAEETGLVSLEPGEIWEETSRLYCVPY